VSVETRILLPGEEDILTRVGPDVFDNPVDEEASRQFLADVRHHLAVAIDDGVVVGFASGVHYIHPDKPRPELWVNEVGVASTHRGQGVGKAVMEALFEHARALGCGAAWVLTDHANRAAMSLYSSVGGQEFTPDPVLFEFALDARGASE
jgi:GNAT superfamily N-acetyltransferase